MNLDEQKQGEIIAEIEILCGKIKTVNSEIHHIKEGFDWEKDAGVLRQKAKYLEKLALKRRNLAYRIAWALPKKKRNGER